LCPWHVDAKSPSNNTPKIVKKSTNTMVSLLELPFLMIIWRFKSMINAFLGLLSGIEGKKTWQFSNE
jgi:hypothetical protein